MTKLQRAFALGVELEKAKNAGLGAKELAVMLGAHYDKATLAGLTNELYKLVKKSQYEQKQKSRLS